MTKLYLHQSTWVIQRSSAVTSSQMLPVPLHRKLPAIAVVQLASGPDNPHSAGVRVVDIRAVDVLSRHGWADPGDDVAVDVKMIGGEVVVENHAIGDMKTFAHSAYVYHSERHILYTLFPLTEAR